MDKIDKQIIDKLMSVAEVMSHFYSRYGTQEAVAKRVLDDLELLPHPNDACLEEENLVKCSGALSISRENGSRNLWTLDRVGKIVNKSFTEVVRHLYWNEAASWISCAKSEISTAGTLPPEDQ